MEAEIEAEEKAVRKALRDKEKAELEKRKRDKERMIKYKALLQRKKAVKEKMKEFLQDNTEPALEKSDEPQKLKSITSYWFKSTPEKAKMKVPQEEIKSVSKTPTNDKSKEVKAFVTSQVRSAPGKAKREAQNLVPFPVKICSDGAVPWPNDDVPTVGMLESMADNFYDQIASQMNPPQPILRKHILNDLIVAKREMDTLLTEAEKSDALSYWKKLDGAEREKLNKYKLLDGYTKEGNIFWDEPTPQIVMDDVKREFFTRIVPSEKLLETEILWVPLQECIPLSLRKLMKKTIP